MEYSSAYLECTFGNTYTFEPFPSAPNGNITKKKTALNNQEHRDLFHLYSTLHSLTGKYREKQGNPCNENRDPAMKTGVPCNEYRFFLVGIDLQGFPVSFTGFGFAV